MPILRDFTETLDKHGLPTGKAREDLTDRELMELIDDKLDALLDAGRAVTRLTGQSRRGRQA